MTVGNYRARRWAKAEGRAMAAVAAGLSLALAFGLASCQRSSSSAGPAAPSVTVTRVARATIEIRLDYPARIRPRQEIVVSPKVAGRVSQVLVDVGQRVSAGQLLFTLESTDYDAQARQAQAALESAKANLTRTSDSSLSSQLIQAQASVQQAQVQYDDASDVTDRTQKLFDAGTATRQQLDSAQAKLKAAGITLDAAKESLSLLQEKAGPQSTGVASSQVDQAQAAADLAQSQLANTRITSPITGLVASRSVDPGEIVSSAVPAIVVIDVSSLTAETSVEEGVVDTVHVGEAVTVSVDAADADGLAGVVETVSPAADPRTLAYTIKVRVDQPPQAVRPGMFARVSFPVDRRADVLAVPNSAILSESGAQYVYTVVNGVLRRANIQTGISDASLTEITAGLSEGAMVVTEGQTFLNDGEKVTPAP